MAFRVLSCLLVIALGFNGITGSAGARELLECWPSATAAADARGVTAEAIADTLALAFGEITTCAGAGDIEGDTSELQIALSLAISTGSKDVEGECGASGSIQAAAEAVAEGVLEEVADQAQQYDERSVPIFQARSAGLQDDVSSRIQSRSAGPLTPEQQAEAVADAVLKAIQDTLKELRCGDEPSEPTKGKKCQYVAGVWVGKDC